MAKSDRLLKRAQSELTLGGGSEPMDQRLWDHSLRVAVCAWILAHLPEVSGQPIDKDALRVAALYHDVGWAIQVRDGHLTRDRVLARPTSDIQLELAAGAVEATLADILPAKTIARAGQAIRGINDRNCPCVEAHLVSDADNLDQIGPVGFLQSARRDVLAGRMIPHVLDTWRRQQEYHYWEARIRDVLRFEAVRKLAWKRLATMDPFMQALGEQINADDVASSLGVATADVVEELGVPLHVD